MMKKKKAAMFLPEKEIADILRLLPVKSLLRFRCVAKPWCSVIDSEYFIQLYMKNASVHNSFNPSFILHDVPSVSSVFFVDSVTLGSDDQLQAANRQLPLNSSRTSIIGSCNGLFCIQKLAIRLRNIDHLSRTADLSTSAELALWNPSTGETDRLPIAPIEDNVEVNHVFGYDSFYEDYKILRISVPCGKNDYVTHDAEVCSLKENSWRPVVVPSHLSVLGMFNPTNGFGYRDQNVLFLDTFHWLLMQGDELAIVSFDFLKEEFETVPLPLPIMQDFNCCKSLGVFGQKLCLVSTPEIGAVDIWVMKEYGVKDSWVKLLSLARDYTEYLQKPTLDSLSFYSKNSNGKVLLEMLNTNKLLWYDLETKTYEVHQIIAAGSIRKHHLNRLHSFVRSHVSPFDVEPN